MTKLKMHSLNKVDKNIEAIGAMFPNCLTERKNEKGEIEMAIDFDMLRQELSSVVVEGPQERYQFTWPDKRQSMLLANSPIVKTLRPCREESKNFDTTENLYIEGDNLDVLKLLQETYLGKVKMIYIDPPYNTGKDFVYADNFGMGSSEFMDASGMYDEDGNTLFDIRQNNESNGRFHTDWLNMIYPRLKIARDLLTDDGVIFISIDDNEVENLKKICDEVFGAGNYIDTLHWKRKKQPSFLAKHTAKLMEYVLVYSKNFDQLEKLSIETLSDATKKVINVSNPESKRVFQHGVRVKIGGDGILPKGRYTIRTMDVEYLQDVVYKDGKTINDIEVISRFSVSQEKITSYIYEDLLFITANNGLRRDVSQEEKRNRKSITDLLLSDYGDNQESDKEFVELFDAKYFEYTKPVKLLYNLAKSLICKDSIILDFFSGSATTAHAVMQLNAEDEGNRKFICVQLPEQTHEKSEARKSGYKNICEIGKERIRRAGEKVKDDNKEKDNIDKLDIGFRVLKLDSTNMKDVYYNPQDYSKELFSDLTDNIKEDRTPEDLLFQVMLELGVLLSAKIEESEIAGKKVFNVNDGYLIACFDDNVTEQTVTEIAKQMPYYFVMRDSSMANDSVASNFEQIFETYSKDTIRKIL